MSGNSPKKHLCTTDENVYPVININQSLWNPLLTKFRRSVASINPFASQQIPTQDRIALGARWGNQFYIPDPYPNGVTFYRMAPSHYDPLEGMNRQSFPLHHRAHAPPDLIPALKSEKYPRGCVKAIQGYKRCKMINGVQACQDEKFDILNVCPRWVVDDMVEKRKFQAKVVGIQKKLYQDAMTVSPYNKGRSVGELEVKGWSEGTRKHLRPDTMWADSRYAEITQQEINEAKARNESRETAKKHQHHDEHHKEHHHHHYDWQGVKKREEAPLYP